MTGRGGVYQSLAAGGTPAQASHSGLGARLVEEHQAIAVYLGRALSPRLALLDDIGAILFAGMERLF